MPICYLIYDKSDIFKEEIYPSVLNLPALPPICLISCLVKPFTLPFICFVIVEKIIRYMFKLSPIPICKIN